MSHSRATCATQQPNSPRHPSHRYTLLFASAETTKSREKQGDGGERERGLVSLLEEKRTTGWQIVIPIRNVPRRRPPVDQTTDPITYVRARVYRTAYSVPFPSKSSRSFCNPPFVARKVFFVVPESVDASIVREHRSLVESSGVSLYPVITHRWTPKIYLLLSSRLVHHVIPLVSMFFFSGLRQAKSRFNDWKTRHVCYTFVEHGRSWNHRRERKGTRFSRMARWPVGCHSYYVRGRFRTDTRCSSAKKGARETVVGHQGGRGNSGEWLVDDTDTR